jgi:hypothetical protein
MEVPITLNLWLKFRDTNLEANYQQHAAAKLRKSFDVVRLALFGCYLSATIYISQSFSRCPGAAIAPTISLAVQTLATSFLWKGQNYIRTRTTLLMACRIGKDAALNQRVHLVLHPACMLEISLPRCTSGCK